MRQVLEAVRKLIFYPRLMVIDYLFRQSRLV